MDENAITFLQAYYMAMMEDQDHNDGLTTTHEKNTDTLYNLDSIDNQYEFICRSDGSCRIVRWFLDENGDRYDITRIFNGEEAGEVIEIKDFPSFLAIMTSVYSRCYGYFDNESWQ